MVNKSNKITPETNFNTTLPNSAEIDSEIEKLSYEEALSELERIVSDLENGQYNLEETLTYFQRGQKLAQHCAKLLDQAELIVKQISMENNNESVDEST